MPDDSKLREAVWVAVQLAVIARDWNLDEVEIDGEMRSTFEIQQQLEEALK